VVSVRPDAARTIRGAGFGVVGDGDLNVVGNGLASLRSDAAHYARCSQALVTWSASR
jgi:hypothetical protein